MKDFLASKKYYILSAIAFAVFVLIKVRFVSHDEFLLNYPYFTSDSLQWFSDALNIFESNDIAFRNPGLVFLIKILNFFNVTSLLPYINHLVLFILLVTIYKTSRIISKSTIGSFLISLALFANFTVQDFTNYVLADLYAVTFIAVGLYSLIKRRYYRSMSLFIISMYFQNYAYFLLGILSVFLAAKAYKNPKVALNYLKTYKIGMFLFIIAFIPLALFHVYKFILFKNPFYTSVAQFELIKPNVDSCFFYFINTIGLFGILGILVIAFIVFYLLKRRKSADRSVLIVISYYAITFIFWFVLYDWNDRRFILYLVPAFYPLALLLIQYLKIYIGSKVVLIISLLCFLPSFINIQSYAVDNLLSFGVISFEFESFRHGGKHKQYDIRFPANIDVSSYKGIYLLHVLTGKSTKTTNKFKGYFLDTQKYYDVQNSTLCFPQPENYSSYAIGSVVFIVTGRPYGELKSKCSI